MKLLWIVRTCPYPANDGEKLRVYNLLKALSVHHEITLVCRVMDPEEQTGLDELRKFCKAVHGVSVPRPQGLPERVKWVAPFVFSRYPVALCTVFFPAIAHVLQELAEKEQFDIVQVEHSSLTIYLDHVHFRGTPPTVVTMHNVDFIRNERIIENTPLGLLKLYHVANQMRFKKWELDSVRRYSSVVAMSEFDKQLLLAELPSLPVHIVPNGVDISGISFSPVTDNLKKIIFVASMDSEANHDGAMFFAKEIYPLVKQKHSSSSITFVGRNPRQELKEIDNGNDLLVTGKVTDVSDYYRQATVAIVPLRSGGGTRLKILEAMAAGTPVVSTTVGCEGLDLIDQEHLLIADTPQAFAAAVSRLLSDTSFRLGLIERARKCVEVHYDWQLIARQHESVYRKAVHHG
jgi:glycosyltransferase involved in cell wall biosynthesis